MDTDAPLHIPKGPAQMVSRWQDKRRAMKNVCQRCHSPNLADNCYKPYDEFVQPYNAEYGQPGSGIRAALKKPGLITKQNFDEKIEWTGFFSGHPEGRRAGVGRQGRA